MEFVLEQEKDDTEALLDHAEATTETHLGHSSNLVKLYPGDVCVLFCEESVDHRLRRECSKYVEETNTTH